MKIRVLGCGLYGAHIGLSLIEAGHEVEIHEVRSTIFAGASGNMPARLHDGQHYPRSYETRVACRANRREFMDRYWQLTNSVPVNLYAIAEQDSLIDFGNYVQTLSGEIEFLTVERPNEFGLKHVEGAIQCGERHLVIDRARTWFMERLGAHLRLEQPPGDPNDPRWDLTVDTTFCALAADGVDRFEPCLTVLLEGPTDWSVTVMDGPFPSLYVWDEMQGISSLTSAKWTPLAKCGTWAEAKHLIDNADTADVMERGADMFRQMGHFWPRIHDEYKPVDYRLAIRAMPKSAADSRLCTAVRTGERCVRVMAGKLSAIFEAERMVMDVIAAGQRKAA